MTDQEVIEELERVKILDKINVNYETDNGKIFEIIKNKELAEKIIGYSISDEDFHNEIELGCGGITNIIDILQPTIYGIMTTPFQHLLDKETIKDCIKIFTYVYNNYDDFYGAYAYKQAIRFYDLCQQYAYMHNTSKRNQKKKICSDNKSGYIYVMKCMGTYKIGKSNNCERLGEYTNLPEEPEYYLVEYVDDMSKVELMLHEHFSSVRRRNGQCEWFDLSEDNLLEIKELVKQHIIKNYGHTDAYKKFVLKSV